MSESDESNDFFDNSICEEIEDLITQCEGIHLHHHNVIDTLESIHHMIKNQNNIIVNYQDTSQDWNTLLETLHTQTMRAIQEDNHVPFSEVLLEVLNTCIFIN